MAMGRLAKPWLRCRAARGFDPLPLRMNMEVIAVNIDMLRP